MADLHVEFKYPLVLVSTSTELFSSHVNVMNGISHLHDDGNCESDKNMFKSNE